MRSTLFNVNMNEIFSGKATTLPELNKLIDHISSRTEESERFGEINCLLVGLKHFLIQTNPENKDDRVNSRKMTQDQYLKFMDNAGDVIEAYTKTLPASATVDSAREYFIAFVEDRLRVLGNNQDPLYTTYHENENKLKSMLSREAALDNRL
jgi:hypothetical protein